MFKKHPFQVVFQLGSLDTFAPSYSELEGRWTHFARAKSPTLGSKPAFCSHFRPFRALNLLRMASIRYQECLVECPVFEQKCPMRNPSTFVRFEHYPIMELRTLTTESVRIRNLLVPYAISTPDSMDFALPGRLAKAVASLRMFPRAYPAFPLLLSFPP